MVWTFKTQSMTSDLQSLAALPTTKTLPTDVTILDAEPGTALGPDVGQIVWGKLHTHLALGADGTLDLVAGKDVDIPFLMTTPKVVPQNGAPVVIVQHGLTRWRGDALAIAEAFAQAGWATIAIDINGHGQRSSCTADADCANSGTCTVATGICSTSLKVNCGSDADCASGGTCDKGTGACSTSLALNSGTCITHLENSAPVTECNPAASGNAFLNFSNPFALRDNFRQHVLDLSQVTRVIAGAGGTDLAAKLAALGQPVKIDPTQTAYLGQSLGGIEGTLFLSVAPSPTVGVLNVPGGRLTDILTTSPTFKPLVGGLLTGFGVQADTAAYFQLLNTLRWIVDPGDPINFGRHVKAQPLNGNAKKLVIVQEAGADMVIPNPWTDALTAEIGLPLLDAGTHPGVSATLITDQASGPQKVSTTFPGASHGFIFAPGTGTATGQAQAVTWISSGGQLISAP
jgi:dienelactone hydrolase